MKRQTVPLYGYSSLQTSFSLYSHEEQKQQPHTQKTQNDIGVGYGESHSFKEAPRKACGIVRTYNQQVNS